MSVGNFGYRNAEFWAKYWGLPVEAVRWTLFAAIKKWPYFAWEDAVCKTKDGELGLERLFCVEPHHEQPLKDVVAKWLKREAQRAEAIRESTVANLV